VVVTDEAVYIKLIYPKDAEHWILASSNPRHKQRTIAIKDVKELWRYRRHVTNKIQWPKTVK
jgi:phage repressor protein C with HTH and peptisase S24 domain